MVQSTEHGTVSRCVSFACCSAVPGIFHRFCHGRDSKKAEKSSVNGNDEVRHVINLNVVKTVTS